MSAALWNPPIPKGFPVFPSLSLFYLSDVVGIQMKWTQKRKPIHRILVNECNWIGNPPTEILFKWKGTSWENEINIGCATEHLVSNCHCLPFEVNSLCVRFSNSISSSRKKVVKTSKLCSYILFSLVQMCCVCVFFKPRSCLHLPNFGTVTVFFMQAFMTILVLYCVVCLYVSYWYRQSHS